MKPPVPDAVAAAEIPTESPPSDTEERELLAGLLRNDRKAAAHFVSAHIDAVHAYARHRLSPRADLVDDVVQDVFLAALNGLGAFEGKSSLRTWVIGIARHKIEDVYRRRLRAAVALDELPDEVEEPLAVQQPLEELLDQARARTKIRRVMARLPEHYGLILLWRYWEHRSTREMASAMGATEKSVERMLARARARFKECWVRE